MKALVRGFVVLMMALGFFMVRTALGEQAVREDELSTISAEAISTVQISARQQIEDKLYGTQNALCLADDSCYMSNEDYLNDLVENLKVLQATNSTYTVDVYGVDYEKGLLDVQINCTYNVLGKIKTISKRKTSIVEIIGKIKEEVDLNEQKDNLITYANQTWNYNYATIYQTKTLEEATATAGTISYSLVSQKDSTNTDVSYFSFNNSTRVLTAAANTPAGTYNVIVRATASATTDYNSAYADSTIAVTISKIDNPLTYADQTWNPAFSASSQSKTLDAATNGQGTVTYSLVSQKQNSTNVNYFTFNSSSRALTVAANTPSGTYTAVVRASAAGNDNYNSGTADSIITVNVGKSDNPLTFTTPQSGSVTFSTTAQNKSFTAATNGQGTVTYSITAQKDSSNATVSYFTIPTSTTASFRVAANTPAGTYTITLRASAAGDDNYNSGTKDATYTLTIDEPISSDFATLSSSVNCPEWSTTRNVIPVNSYNSQRATLSDNVFTIIKSGTYTVSYSISGGWPGTNAGGFVVRANIDGSETKLVDTGYYGFNFSTSGSTNITLTAGQTVYFTYGGKAGDYNISVSNGSVSLTIVAD